MLYKIYNHVHVLSFHCLYILRALSFSHTQEYTPLDSSPSSGQSTRFAKGRQHMVLITATNFSLVMTNITSTQSVLLFTNQVTQALGKEFLALAKRFQSYDPHTLRLDAPLLSCRRLLFREKKWMQRVDVKIKKYMLSHMAFMAPQ